MTEGLLLILLWGLLRLEPGAVEASVTPRRLQYTTRPPHSWPPHQTGGHDSGAYSSHPDLDGSSLGWTRASSPATCYWLASTAKLNPPSGSLEATNRNGN